MKNSNYYKNLNIIILFIFNKKKQISLNNYYQKKYIYK